MISPTWEFSENVRKLCYDFSAVVGILDTKSRLFRAAREILDNISRTHKNGVVLLGEPCNGRTFFDKLPTSEAPQTEGDSDLGMLQSMSAAEWWSAVAANGIIALGTHD